MILIALCSSLIGATLGTRLKVISLLPATLVGVGLIVVTAALRGSTVSATIVAVLVWTIFLQLGYLGGLLTRFSLAAARLAPDRSRRSTAHPPLIEPSVHLSLHSFQTRRSLAKLHVSSRLLLERLDGSLSTAFTLFLVSIIFACGSTFLDGPAAQSLIAVLAALALACVGIFARAGDVDLATRSTRGIKLAAAVPAIWMAIQLLPTPIGAHSIWNYANDAMGRQSWGHVSVDLGMTTLALVFYLANVSLILVGIFVARDRRGAELVLAVVTATMAITIIVLLIGKSGLIPGFDGDLNEILGAVSAFGILLSLTSGTRAIEQRGSRA